MVATAFFAGCGERKNYDNQSKNKEDQNAAIDSKQGKKAEEIFTLKKGSFVIPDGWKLHEGDSTDEKPFVVPADYNGEGNPDNISVNYGTNPYSKEDVDTFSHAILAQLRNQLAGHDAGAVAASGYTSKQGYPVLKFAFTVDGSNVVQYYIVNDHGHILVNESNYSGQTESSNTASQSIVDSFKWK